MSPFERDSIRGARAAELRPYKSERSEVIAGYCMVSEGVVASRQFGSGRGALRRLELSARGLDLPAEILRVSAQSPSADVLRYAAERLLHGEVVAIPTDTVYGLAADPFNLSAVEEIFRVKGRPEERALPILVNSLDQAMLLAREVPRNFLRLAEQFWPGALTLVVDASHRLPLKVTANTGRIALRWPRSEVVARLIEECDGPLTGTSANLSGSPACVSSEQVFHQLGDRLGLILDGGETKSSSPSTIVELQGAKWTILRKGAISANQIEEALQ